MANLTTSTIQPGAAPDPDLIWICGGTFRMGSEDFYPEARPGHRVYVTRCWIDRNTVTDERFTRLVAATGYNTLVKWLPIRADFPRAPAPPRSTNRQYLSNGKFSKVAVDVSGNLFKDDEAELPRRIVWWCGSVTRARVD